MSALGYELRRSSRRTLSLEISRDAKLIVRAPYRMPLSQIEEFVRTHEGWIQNKMQSVISQMRPEPSESEVVSLKERAKQVLTEMTAHYAKRMGVTYTNVGITGAVTRFGSCSRKGSISYSWRLMLYPEDAWDYVVVHELCHLKHFNHSKEFWREVELFLPDYKRRKAMLK